MIDTEVFTLVKDGSDADFEYTCSPCGDDDIRVEAVKYCPVCQEYMCATCVRHHARPKATRSHTLLDCDASIKVKGVTMVTKCRYHPDRDIEMYCGEHELVCCMKCIVMEHRSCSGVISLEDVNVTSNQDKEINRLKAEMENLKKRLKDNERKMQTSIGSIKEQRSEVISKLEEIEQDLVDHIRKLKKEALATLDTEYTLVKEKIEINISKIKKLNVEIEQELHRLQSFGNLNKMQQFVQINLIQQTANNAMNLIEQHGDEEFQSFHFTENKELKTYIIASTSLGRVRKDIEGKHLRSSTVYKVSAKNEINVKMKNDRKECNINGICQLSDGTIVLTDNNNKKIKRLDVNLDVKDYLDVGDYPTGICCTGNTEVAVKLYNNIVQFISIGNSLSKLKDISVEGGDQWGIAYCSGELWVSTDSGLDVYSLSGTLLKTITKDVDGANIFRISPEQMAVSGDNVIVTDNGDGAVCLNTDGTKLRELRDVRLNTTKSVCVSNDGTVFIAGYDSHNLVMFGRDGECLGELLDKDSGLKHPISMCFDKMKNCLIAANGISNDLVVLKMTN